MGEARRRNSGEEEGCHGKHAGAGQGMETARSWKRMEEIPEVKCLILDWVKFGMEPKGTVFCPYTPNPTTSSPLSRSSYPWTFGSSLPREWASNPTSRNGPGGNDQDIFKPSRRLPVYTISRSRSRMPAACMNTTALRGNRHRTIMVHASIIRPLPGLTMKHFQGAICHIVP